MKDNYDFSKKEDEAGNDDKNRHLPKDVDTAKE